MIKKINEYLIKYIGFYSLIHSMYLTYKPFLCSHDWEYWHAKLICDHHRINGTILNNNIRRCDKCGRQQFYRLVPKNNGWVNNSLDLPKDSKYVEMFVNVLGKRNRAQIREDKLNKLIKKES